MKEYKIVDTKKHLAERVMNEMAEQGWEVVSTTYYHGGWSPVIMITFSREKNSLKIQQKKSDGFPSLFLCYY